MEKKIFLKNHRDIINRTYQQLEHSFPVVFEEINRSLEGLDENIRLAVQYLYTAMPYSDIGNYPFETYLSYAKHGVFLWENKQIVQALPEDIYLNYVLHYRVNEEEIQPCRALFYHQIEKSVSADSGIEAILDINYWCAGEVTYQTTDDRTLSALAIYERGNGRCGEESVFAVNAYRSIGIPSRQVYAPWWSHCDDNHAWVEVWNDGKWYFLGACEPEAVLNRGWFTNASSRAMMVHSRWFDGVLDLPLKEDVIGQNGMVVTLNQTQRYANTKTLTICVTDEENRPVTQASVVFQVFNYASLSSISEVMTDDQGRAHIETGLGSLYVLASHKGCYGAKIIDVKEDSDNLHYITISKDWKLKSDWQAFDMIAPKDAPINTAAPTKDQKEESKVRTDAANNKRIQKVSSWVNEEVQTFLSSDKDRNSNIGLENRNDASDLRKKLVDILTAKDLTDCKATVLEDHLLYTKDLQKEDDLFVSYVLNPRIWDEVLSPYRSIILNTLTDVEKETFKEDPKKIWEWICNHIKTENQKEHDALFTTPAAILKIRIGSQKSKEVLFVAIARTLGIPARLHPYDHAMEFVQDGDFVTVLESQGRTAHLELRNKDNISWKYMQNWSIARWTEGKYETLSLSNVEWQEGSIKLLLPEGRYRILTGNRLPNGNIFAYQKEICLDNEKVEYLDLKLRQANLDDLLLQISIQDLFLKDQAGKSISMSELTKDKKRIIMWLEESMEPTEHILNELLELDHEFTKYKDHIVLIANTHKALEDPTLSRVLERFPTIKVYYDDSMNTSASNVEIVGRRVYVDHEKLPLIIVTDKELHVVYATSGYNVGTGEMLLRIMEALK